MRVRYFRVAILASGLAAVAVVGCSLALDFDESKIPGDDTGVTEEDSAVPDTGTDTNKLDGGADTTDTADTAVPPDTSDTAVPPDTADAGDTADSTVADTADSTVTDTADSTVADTADSTVADTGTDTADSTVADTGTDTADSTTADTGTDTADSTAADTADAGVDTADSTVDDTADAGTDTADSAVVDTADSAVADTADSAADTTDTADAAPTTIAFATVLSGSQETPANASLATGTATFTLNETAATLTYTITHTVSSPTGAHFHTGFGGVAGGVTFDLGTATSPIAGTWTGLSATNIADLKAGKIYVNVHTSTFTGGEIRGQLVRPGESFYTAVMDGTQEVPATTATETGAFALILDVGGTNLSYVGTIPTFVSGAVTGAHIHAGAAGVAGSIVYPLDFATFVGTLTGITASDITHLGDASYYINVHTATLTGGAIRGQIIKHFTAPIP